MIESVEIVFAMLKPMISVGITECIIDQKKKVNEMGPKVGF